MDDERTQKLNKHEPIQGYHDAYYTTSASPAPVSSNSRKLTLALDVRRALIFSSTVVAVAAIVGLTYFFHRGLELRKYDAKMMSQKERDDLLDKYNGYSGTVSSAVGRPLEMVVSMTTQLLVFRFLTSALLQREPKWYVGLAAMAIGNGLGFLLNNGISALNVQLRDLDVKPVIMASDLMAPIEHANASAITNITKSYSELQPRNPMANTILRNVILPRITSGEVQCKATGVQQRLFEDSVTYGFKSSDWMKYVLPESLDAKKLRVIINATDANANKNVKSADLPMNASRAADLFVTGAILTRRYLPWGKAAVWIENLPSDIASKLKEGATLPTAVAAGLLPNKIVSELEQRDYFLRASQTFFNTREMLKSNASRANIEMEFAHVDISDQITFDSMTWRVEMNPTQLGFERTTVNNVVHSTVGCGPWPGICSIQKLTDDPDVLVHAYAACANEDGTETLQSLPKSQGYMADFYIQCPHKSNSSLLLVSVTRRLTADSILENTGIDSSKGLIQKQGSYVAVNPRKFYSMTVSRLGWTTENLATKFDATCDSPGGCNGLYLETSNNKSLIAGVESLPFTSLKPIDYGFNEAFTDLLPFRVVTVTDPPLPRDMYDYKFGDYILPHNIANLKMNRTRQAGEECRSLEEERQQLVFNNHIYMESTLQTTYTAGVFLLFQSAAVKSKVLRRGLATTLAFDGNKQQLSLWISIPTNPAILTGAGCVLLVLGCLAAMVWSTRRTNGGSDTLQSITTPHVIARVILDDNAFPSSVVRRRVVYDPDNHIAPDHKKSSQLDQFYINSISLKRIDATEHTGAGFV